MANLVISWASLDGAPTGRRAVRQLERRLEDASPDFAREIVSAAHIVEPARALSIPSVIVVNVALTIAPETRLRRAGIVFDVESHSGPAETVIDARKVDAELQKIARAVGLFDVSKAPAGNNEIWKALNERIRKTEAAMFDANAPLEPAKMPRRFMGDAVLRCPSCSSVMRPMATSDARTCFMCGFVMSERDIEDAIAARPTFCRECGRINGEEGKPHKWLCGFAERTGALRSRPTYEELTTARCAMLDRAATALGLARVLEPFSTFGETDGSLLTRCMAELRACGAFS